MKNYIPVEDTNRLIVSRFDYENIQYEQMYARAKKLMRVYGQNILESDSNFISDKE